MADKLIIAEFPAEALIMAIKTNLKKQLDRYANKMKQIAGTGTSPSSPSWWSGNIQSYIDVEDLSEGGEAIHFGVGLIKDTPEQALWQAYIFNFGSGQYGKNGLITSQPSYYNVNTGSMEKGRSYYREYPQFAKQKNAWFDDVAATMDLPLIMQSAVEEAVATLFETGTWKLDGNHVEVNIKL